jgi:outer membrane protein assembly factor BamA
MRRLPILALACLALTVVPRAAAQAPPPPASSVIAEIHFTGSQHYSEAVLAATSGLKPGDAVTREQLQAIADGFAALGIFSRANYRYTNRGAKIVVQFEFEDAPTIPVSFDNFPWFTDDEIAAAIRADVPLFDGTAPTDGSMLDQMDDAISNLLSKRGVSGAIHHTLMAQPAGDDKMMQFHLDGSQLAIGSLEYGDPLAGGAETLHDRNSDLLGKPFSRFAIDIFENEQVRPLYLAAGRLAVRFGAPTLKLSGDPNQPLPAKLDLVLPIDPGPVFQFSGVTPTGNTALDAPAITRLLSLPAGQLADGMKLADSWQHIEQEYAHMGYLDVMVDPQPQFDPAAGVVSYRLVITEGPKYHMGDLILTGLSLDAADALRLRWELHRGAVADGNYVDEMITKLEKPNKQIFGDLPVHYRKMGHLLRTNPDTQTVDVMIDFQ